MRKECGLKAHTQPPHVLRSLAPFGIQSPVLVCRILFFKHSPMRCKVRKLLTGTFGRQGSLVYPMAALLDDEVVLCVRVCVLLCFCVCVCVGVNVYGKSSQI